jgi:pyruvate formate lyase activating enzyme
VIYTKGCNFRCPFCHNPSLVTAEGEDSLQLEEVIPEIAKRRDFIDGVVITGGEPTIHRDIDELIQLVKRLDLAVKLDTNGYRPKTVGNILNNKMVDCIAMDIKTSLSRYPEASGVDIVTDKILESIEMIRESGIEHEFRTTCVPALVNGDDIYEISRMVGKTGNYTLQQFQAVDTFNPEFLKISPFRKEILQEFLNIAAPNVATCRLIGVD